MPPRPLSVTIVSGVLIAQAMLGFVGTLLALNLPEVREAMEEGPISVEAQLVWSFVGFGILVICAVGMLMRGNWARILYIVWSVCSLALGFYVTTAPAMMIPSLVIFLLFAFLLFRPAANVYFQGRSGFTEPPVPPPGA